MRYLSVKEFSTRTGLAERTVRALIANGRLPVVRPPGLRVVRISEDAARTFMTADAPASHPAK